MSYDSCRRGVKRLVEKYHTNLSDSAEPFTFDSTRHTIRMEKAALAVIEKKKLHQETKKSGKKVVISKFKNGQDVKNNPKHFTNSTFVQTERVFKEYKGHCYSKPKKRTKAKQIVHSFPPTIENTSRSAGSGNNKSSSNNRDNDGGNSNSESKSNDNGSINSSCSVGDSGSLSTVSTNEGVSVDRRNQFWEEMLVSSRNQEKSLEDIKSTMSIMLKLLEQTLKK
ncbi:hypothetical protein J3Q64DRAFT_1739809 [Phycomyces blakesleeanus]